MMDSIVEQAFVEQLETHLTTLYPELAVSEIAKEIVAIFGPPPESPEVPSKWSEEDCLLITYADSIVSDREPPLQTLKNFLLQHCGNTVSSVHILPFYPFSSDDGFSVIDYLAVREDLGSWSDVSEISEHYKLMVDLVINHVSSESEWFKKYCEGSPDFENFFIEASIEDDLSQVVRPRASPLLRATQTSTGVTQLWCTFSHDQVDLNFRNPIVLLEFLKTIRDYIQHGAKIIRLDAIGYLWKETGTTCIHLPQTHEVVRLIRAICDYVAPETVLITETNVPNHENLTYFGNRNEAHSIYNFSLAPLLVHALLTGETGHLKKWMMSMPPAPDGCFYLNFTASHDGIGMRPAEGLLSDHEQLQLIETVRNHGGLLSTRRTNNGSERVYELNVSLFDALRGTVKGPDEWQTERFLCSQTVMLGVEGIPAIYIHSLLATPNDLERVAETGRNRSINRHQWQSDTLDKLLADPASPQSRVSRELLRRLKIRSGQSAFHPNATQFTLQLAEPFFAFWRQSRDRSQSIFAIHNMTAQEQIIVLSELNLIATDQWYELISGRPIADLTGSLTLAPYDCLWISNQQSTPA